MNHEIWNYQVVGIKEHLSPADKIPIPGYFNLKKTHFLGIGVVKTLLASESPLFPMWPQEKRQKRRRWWEQGKGGGLWRSRCTPRWILANPPGEWYWGGPFTSSLVLRRWCKEELVEDRANLSLSDGKLIFFDKTTSNSQYLEWNKSLWTVSIGHSVWIPSFVFTDL